jgi:hypothetical protein
MEKWISFSDLLKRWGIKQFELLDYLKDELQPYSEISGRPIECPQFCHAGYIKKSIIKSGLEVLSDAKGRNLNEYEKILVLMKKDAELELQRIEKDDPNFISWKWLEESEDNYQKLYKCLDEAIFKIDDVLKFDKEFKQKKKKEKNVTNNKNVYQCLPGTEWKDVIITFVENDVVRIETPRGDGRYSYHELGMSDKRGGNKPIKIWHLLQVFARLSGRIGSGTGESVDDLPNLTKRLNRHFKNLFEIDDSIYLSHYRKSHEYVTKFEINDNRDQKNIIGSQSIEFGNDERTEVTHKKEIEKIEQNLGINDSHKFDG